MSSPSIFRGGTIAVQPFTAGLGDVAANVGRKKTRIDFEELRQRTLEEAREEGLQAGKEEGFQAGMKAGYQAGYDQAYAEGSSRQEEMLREFASELQQVPTKIEEGLHAYYEAAERELERMAVHIAERLLAAQLTIDRSVIVEAVASALGEVANAHTARVRVNPFDSHILSEHKQRLMAASAGLRGVEIVDDSSIFGGCIVETERGVLDATVETRVSYLHENLEEAA